MKTKTQLTSIIILALAWSSFGAVLDFETLNSTVPVEGMAISNQFKAHFGMSFRRGDGGFPVIGKKGAPMASFIVQSTNPDLYDTLHPSDPRANSFGDFFLSDDGIFGGTKQLFVDFTTPVARASGYIFDIDGSDQITITAYSDYGTNSIGEIVITSGDPETGDGRSTPWSFDHSTNDIQHIRFRETAPGSDVNVAWDDFSSSFAPLPQQSAALDVHMFAGISLVGDIGRPYRIEYSEHLTPTNNWLGLTNLFLPSSPFLFIDVASTNSAQRFYRVVSLP